MKNNLIKLFISFVVCFTGMLLLKLNNHYDYISFLIGALTYSLYTLILAKYEKKRILNKIQK